MSEINKIRGKTAVVGLAEAGCGVTPNWSAMELMATAVHDALDDAGINLSQVDGLFAATAFHSMAAMSLSEYLGIRPKFELWTTPFPEISTHSNSLSPVPGNAMRGWKKNSPVFLFL